MKLAFVFLLLIAAAEAVTLFVDPLGGIVAFGFILLFALLIPALKNEYFPSRLILSLSLVPMVRIVSLSMPLENVPRIWWFPIMYTPLFLAALVVAFMLGLRLKETGFNLRRPFINLLVGISGIGLGFMEYLILKPEPMVAELTWQAALVPALILLFTTGMVEEYIFRGVLQQTAIELYGKWGIVYVSLIFAVLHMGFLSVADIFFVLVAGLYFGWVVHKTGSLTGVILAHGATNIVLFIVAPLLF
ncbi:MAG: CPBP family intramembrane metalloprotease [Dehalococcoidaceae bacterium]|nr:CPBP family intramembrane metalloprotease [Dehalococcoidaceae bacterium]